MRAKTYFSSNNFTAPQNLSTFGIQIGKKNPRFLGLEEFNFIDIIKEYKYNDLHIAYLPCFQSKRNSEFDYIKLFFYNHDTKQTIHYATIYNVKQITSDNISIIRKELTDKGLCEQIENSSEFRNNYNEHFDDALKIWKDNFKSNVIIAKNGEKRFIVNTFYKKIEFCYNIMDWSNLKRATPLFND